MQLKVSIIGAGPAGFALATDLEIHGTTVLIYSHPDHLRHASDVFKKGRLRANGVVKEFTVPRITSDIGETVDFSDIMILTVPSTGQDTMLKELKAFDLSRHTLIAVPGNLFSLIKDPEMEVGCILETNLSPYSCRMDDGELDIFGRKGLFFIAARQRDLSPTLLNKLNLVFPMELSWRSNVLEVCLLNINGVFHPLMMLMNAGRIESTGGDFFFYRDGLTRSVANAILAVDRVRRQIGLAFGFQLRSVIEVSNDCYQQGFTDLVDLAQNSRPHNKLKAPSDLQNRNFSEDVADLLVCWHGLAEKLEIDASPIKAVIVLVEMATGNDHLTTGRNLGNLHLGGVSRAELIQKFSVSTSQCSQAMADGHIQCDGHCLRTKPRV